eukprot:CAMPEP_0201673220 /NCGR_PEP_ID=MMETSP0494-20130426/34112_1 /ASSEMBLY_ACC=CAM_ASM_000839 /TAXON_ID=420259 /ORGANISM="Thalassiosira gravida, Strain GMp14c1" /LENGTH=54 /DNA_ID=CAMNT_0048155077 /DNA_START=50 /DNA_END=212 /DNA_ORIENTATION=+
MTVGGRFGDEFLGERLLSSEEFDDVVDEGGEDEASYSSRNAAMYADALWKNKEN